MFKVLIGVLSLLLVLALIPVVVIACSAPSSPPAMASMVGPLSRVSLRRRSRDDGFRESSRRPARRSAQRAAALGTASTDQPDPVPRPARRPAPLARGSIRAQRRAPVRFVNKIVKNRRSQVRTRLSGGGKRIRTFGPATLQADPISAVCDHDFAEMPATFEMAVCRPAGARSAKGHKDQFSRPRPSGRCLFRKRSLCCRRIAHIGAWIRF